MDRARYSKSVIPLLPTAKTRERQYTRETYWRTLVTGLNQLSFLPVAAAVALAAVCARADDAALAPLLRAKEQGVALPGAISAGTPMSDATKTGDSFYTNEMVDNVLVSRDGFCDAATAVYAHGHDLKDPLISPVYGDMHGFRRPS